MFDASSIIVGLEIGTSKVTAVVGEVNPAGAVNIIGIGQARSHGVRKGEIIDPEATVEDIRHAVVEAEQMADVEIRSVYLGVTGAHLRGFNNRGFHPIVSADRQITEADVQDVIKNAKAINLPAENHVVHVIRQHFIVDGQSGVQNPVAMVGSRIEVEVHVIHGNTNRLQNSIRAVQALQLEVESIVFNGLADSLALLKNEHKELGSLVIDLGGGTTDYLVCLDGVIKHTGVLAVGGDHITNDLAFGLKIPMARAEQFKISYGAAGVEIGDQGRHLAIPREVGLPEQKINLEHLRRVMALRVEEIFELIEQELAVAGLLDYLRSGVFLSGGGSRIPGVQKLAERIFHLPVHVGATSSLSGIPTSLDQPEFATGLGLVKFGAIQQKGRRRPPFLSGGLRKTFHQFFRRTPSKTL